MVDAVTQAVAIGQAMWLDYIRRGMLASGELQQYIDQGMSGVTSNPTIFEKAIVGSTDYDAALRELASANGRQSRCSWRLPGVTGANTAADAGGFGDVTSD